MNKIPLTDILKLSVAERLHLIEQIWGTIEAEAADVPLTDQDRRELDRRLDGIEASPGAGRPWHEIEARLLAHG